MTAQTRRRRRTTALALCLTAACAPPALGQATGDLDEIVVTGRRGGVPAYERPFGPTVLDAELATAPQRRLDEALRSVPGFGLFRRNGSRLANPTTQGVSLRGIGPNGAGRTLVLVDGVPVNDPFGGWVYWSRLPTAAAERVVITRGGGAGPWGNAAIAGTVRIETRTTDGAFADLAAGSDDTRQAVATLGRDGDRLDLGLTASAFSTGGQPVVRADFRGPVDIAADSAAYALDGTAGMDLEDVRATLKLSGFREHRGNGTPYTENATEALEASLRLVGTGRTAWEAVLYARDWTYESTFSGVSDDRTTETPALDQFDVPSTALGGVAQIALDLAPGHRTDIGVDVRATEGETNEAFFFQNGAFTRERTAGGEQVIAGTFAEHAWTPRPDIAVTAGVRLDWWRNADGERVETNRLTGAALRDERFDTRTGWEVNGRLGADWQVDATWGLRGAVYTGFRLPTLNELYRPFRVGDDITEANPALRPERLTGGEVGLRLTPHPAVRLEATLFRAVLENAVDNVELSRTPGPYAPLGVFVPAGGSVSQRLNLDEVTVDGVEVQATLTPADSLTFSLSWLYSDGEITDAGAFAALQGNRLGQAPRHQGTAEAAWRPIPSVVTRLQLRGATDAFEGSDNTATLDGYVTADAYLGWDATADVHLYATVENLADRDVQTGIRADGLVNVGPGRQWLLGVKARW